MPREPRDDAALIHDMITYSRKATAYVRGLTEEQYRANEIVRMAVERVIEVIGEACRSVSEKLRAAHPEVPWTLIELQRHVLAHDYGEIDDEKIWRVATVHIPIMLPQLEKILAEFPPPGDSP